MRGGGSKEKEPPGGREGEIRRRTGGRNVKILLPGTELQGFAWSKERAPPSAWEEVIRRRECENFAPRNGATRVSWERGAKRGRRHAAERAKSGGGNVKILLPGTELQGLAGRGEQREAAAERLGGRNPAAEM